MRVIVLQPYTKFEVRRPCSSEDMAHDVWALLGLVTLTLKLICESHQRWGTFFPNLDTLGLWVLELFAIYRTDRQSDGQKQRLLPPSVWAPPNGQSIVRLFKIYFISHSFVSVLFCIYSQCLFLIIYHGLVNKSCQNCFDRRSIKTRTKDYTMAHCIYNDWNIK